MLRRRKELATALEKERKPSAPVEKRDARKRPDRALERRREKDARRADELLEAIGAMETSLKELELLLAEPDTHRNGEKARALVARRQALSKEIAERVGEWEETQRRLDAQEAHA
jgi:hypothetical protein